MKPGSLVRRLVWLAAAWIIAALLLTGVALSAFFQQSTLRQFDRGLAETVTALLAGTNIDADGTVLPAVLGDAAHQRAYSGVYHQLGEIGPGGRTTVLSRSRSLWDAELTLPPDVSRRLQSDPGRTTAFDLNGPAGEPLRAAALLSRLPGRAAPLVFIAAEDRSALDADTRRFALTTALALLALGAGLVAAVFVQVRFGCARCSTSAGRSRRVRRKARPAPDRRHTRMSSRADRRANCLLDHIKRWMERQRTHVAQPRASSEDAISGGDDPRLSATGRAGRSGPATARRHARPSSTTNLRASACGRARTSGRATGDAGRARCSRSWRLRWTHPPDKRVEIELDARRTWPSRSSAMTFSKLAWQLSSRTQRSGAGVGCVCARWSSVIARTGCG
jgi:hypothetical protein